MSTAVDGIRHLARIVTIEDTEECVYPADSIHAARPAGTLWQVVTSKTMTSGDTPSVYRYPWETGHPAFRGRDSIHRCTLENYDTEGYSVTGTTRWVR